VAPQVIIIGAGAIGGTVGAYLARTGLPVTFIDRDRAHVEAMRRDGLTIEAPSETFNVSVQALLPGELKVPQKIVLLAVKTQDTMEGAQLAAPVLAEDGMVVSLQNGLCERVIADVVGPARTMGAFVNFSADLLEPGRVRFFGPGDFFVGEIGGTVTTRARDLARMLSAWGRVEVTDNIWGYLWSKLAYGAMVYATALVDADQADIIEQYRPLMIDLAAEISEVALREGVRLRSFHGFEPDLYLPREQRDPSRIRKATNEMLDYMRRHQKPRSGIWRDIAVRRRKTDVDCSIGLVARIGAERGLKLPLTHRLIELVHEVEEGVRPMSFANVEILETLRRKEVSG
jgi:2-dehydropantoate 2-reductase